MLYYALVFLVVGLLAGALGGLRCCGDGNADRVDSVCDRVILIVVHLVTGRGDRVLRP
jgi:uncharacterized membrane protein YtjA (UPF0391 family)